MDSGKHYITKTTDPENCLVGKKEKTRAGFFYNRGNDKGVLLFAVEGDYVSNIKSFGTTKFLKVLKDYSPIVQTIIDIRRG